MPNWAAAVESLNLDSTVPEVEWVKPGERAALHALRQFLRRVNSYDDQRNDPTKRNGTSSLSPYLHFGMLSAQRIVLEVKRITGASNDALFCKDRTTGPQAFCEELGGLPPSPLPASVVASHP